MVGGGGQVKNWRQKRSNSAIDNNILGPIFFDLNFQFLSDPGVPGVRSMGPDVRHWQDYFEDLTDVTLADEDSNSIPTDDVNRTILSNLAMQVAPSGGQHWN